MKRHLSFFSFYGGSLLLLLKLDSITSKREFEQKRDKLQSQIKYHEFISLFNRGLIFNDKDQMMNISIPFNREIKKIYDLDLYYVDYENYDFNKLSDLFLNIHIFIN